MVMERFIQRNQYEVTMLDSEWLILNTDEFTVTKLNEIGGFCWQLLSEVQTVDTLVEAVKKRYLTNQEESLLKNEMIAFLFHLQDCRLIQNVS